MTTKTALLSVSDRTGLLPFAKALSELGFRLLATSGTGKELKAANIPFVGIDEYTNQPEILEGRVKTLHPKIHAGLLAKQNKPEHLAQLEAQEIFPITVAAINLYPFEDGLKQYANDEAKMIELVDIGGPTMIRAAAKNFQHVIPVIDPADYSSVIEFLSKGENPPNAYQFRKQLASKVFTRIQQYDTAIANFFTGASSEKSIQLTAGETLRYGENPHQKAELFTEVPGAFARALTGAKGSWKKLHGKELSYNNLLDCDAALSLLRSLNGAQPTAVILKHLNPCGAAIGETVIEALQKAKRSDPRSHFGGILGFTKEVTKEVADEIREGFAELVLAPSFAADALAVLQQSKALRILQIDLSKEAAPTQEIRSVEGGILLQERDTVSSDEIKNAVLKNGEKPTGSAAADVEFAYRVCAAVKSNAIVVVKNGTLLGTGAGQMSRIDSVEVALSKAKFHGHDLSGAVAASDAFFPFPDNVETLAKAGVKTIIVPGGAKRDDEVIATAKQFGVNLLFVESRHFRH